MIKYTRGDILAADVEALVNTVNCVGIMGRGIALQFKNAFPANYKAYSAACDRKEVQPGSMFIFETDALTNPKYIINFPTKRHWRGKSRIEDIESGLKALVREIEGRKIKSIAIPPLGSGLGGLNWATVRERIEHALSGIVGTSIVVYEPDSRPSTHSMSRTQSVPKMTEGRAALIVLIDRYLRGLLDPFVTLLEIHKLMYFMQEAGQPLSLNYTKGHFGPYADNLRHVLKATEGYFTVGYEDGGDAPSKEIALVPGATEDAEAVLAESARSRFDRVADLVSGFESPFGLELLSTVHWVITKDHIHSRQAIAQKVHAWADHKKRFSKDQIALAMEVLSEKGWLGTVLVP